MRTKIIDLLEQIEGDSAFSGFSDVLKERLYEMIDALKFMNFEDLLIVSEEYQQKEDGWSRRVKYDSKMSALLEIWDIDNDDCEIVQVMRHLKNLLE